MSSSQQQWAMLLNCPSFKLYKDFAQYCTTYGIGKKGSDVIPAAGQAFTCLLDTVLRSLKGRTGAECCLQKEDADAGDLMQGNTAVLIPCRQPL